MARILSLAVVASLGLSGCTWFSAAHPEGRWLWLLTEIGYFCDSDDPDDQPTYTYSSSGFQTWGETYLTSQDTFVVNMNEYGLIMTGTSDKSGFAVSQGYEVAIQSDDCPLQTSGYELTVEGTWGDDLFMDALLEIGYYDTYDDDCPNADREDRCVAQYDMEGTLMTGSDKDFAGHGNAPSNLIPSPY